MKQPFDYAGKTVFVAGGSSGINLGIADTFAASGAKVAIASRSQDRVDPLTNCASTAAGEVVGYSADVRDYAAIASVLGKAHQRFGAFDALISGAGITHW